MTKAYPRYLGEKTLGSDWTAQYLTYERFLIHADQVPTLDLFCGGGAGTRFIGEALDVPVLGLDSQPEAIAFANETHGTSQVKFDVVDLASPGGIDSILARVVALGIKQVIINPDVTDYLSLEGLITQLIAKKVERIFFALPTGPAVSTRAKELLLPWESRLGAKLIAYGTKVDPILVKQAVTNGEALDAIQRRHFSRDPRVAERTLLHIDKRKRNFKIVCIMQVYNEIQRENLDRCMTYLIPAVDELVVYDDASTDGTYERVQQYTPHVLHGGSNEFTAEISHKQTLLNYALSLGADFILWLDADEVLTRGANQNLQRACAECVAKDLDAMRFHELNLWRSGSWRRMDSQYDTGWFIRLWRVKPGMRYEEPQTGLHAPQHPGTIRIIEPTEIVEVIHYGFASERSLAFKFLTYRSHGQSGWELERLLNEDTLEVIKMPREKFPVGLYQDAPPPAKRSYQSAVECSEALSSEVFKPGVSFICIAPKTAHQLNAFYEGFSSFTRLRGHELLIVDQNPAKEIRDYVVEKGLKLVVPANTDGTLSGLLNFAAKEADGNYLLFLTADFAFTSNWLDRLLDKMDGSVAVSPRVIYRNKTDKSDTIGLQANFGAIGADFSTDALTKFGRAVRESRTVGGGVSVPLLIRSEHFISSTGFQGIGANVTLPTLDNVGIKQVTAFDSLVYRSSAVSLGDSPTTPVEFTRAAPLISVVMAWESNGLDPHQALKSLSEQPMENYEVILVGQIGSRAHQLRLSSLAERDSRRRVVLSQWNNLSEAFKLGIAEASANWVLLCGTSDVLEPKAFVDLKQAIDLVPEAGILYGGAAMPVEIPPSFKSLGATDQAFEIPVQTLELFKRNYLFASPILVNNSVLSRCSGLDDVDELAWDLELGLRMSTIAPLQFLASFRSKRVVPPTPDFIKQYSASAAKVLKRFVDKNSFEAIFPFIKFSDPGIPQAVMERVLIASVDLASLMYVHGESYPGLLYRMAEWLSTGAIEKETRSQLLKDLERISNQVGQTGLPSSIKDSLRALPLAGQVKFIYRAS